MIEATAALSAAAGLDDERALLYSDLVWVALSDAATAKAAFETAHQRLFGFVEPDGQQYLLEVTAGDYINVPANTEHWFEMKDCTRCKAVRYFIDTSGWTPLYTGRPLAFKETAATV